MKKWSKSRYKELAMLQELLMDAESIDHGSNALARIESCIKLAKELRNTDYNTGRLSFMQFLIGVAAGEEKKNV